MNETKKDITSLLELTEKSQEEPLSDFVITSEPETSFEESESLFETKTQTPSEPPSDSQDFILPLETQEPKGILPQLEKEETPFLFSLRITGLVVPEEKQKILELIEKYQLEIAASDLELQWESGQILLPRISEYTAVLLVQSLRTCQARLEAGPCDSIFSTPETRSEHSVAPTTQVAHATNPLQSQHAMNSLPMSTQSHFSEPYQILEALSATAVISTHSVESNAPDYEETLEGLKKKLRYLAFRKKADAVLNFKIQLDLLQNAHYRIHLTGTAIRYKDLHS
jgi:hypothetical protein